MKIERGQRAWVPARVRARWAALAACLVGLVAALAMSPSHASTSQQWAAAWNPGDPIPAGTASGQGSGGTLAINPGIPGATLSGTATLHYEPATARIRSRTQIDGTVFGAGNWGDLVFFSFNEVSFTDQLTVPADGFGFLKVMIRVTGTISHNGEIIEAPVSFADVTLTNYALVNASIQDGESSNFLQQIQSQFDGFPSGVFSVNESQSVYRFVELIVPWDEDLPVTFNFLYRDVVQFTINGVDAIQVNLSAINSLGQTVQLFADAFDANGNWLEGVQVVSSSGIGYQSFVASVPEPSSLLLTALGVLGLLARLRRAG